MAKVFAANVHVLTEEGETVSFEPGDTLPEWAEDLVTNPGCFVDEDTEAVAEPAAAAAAATVVDPAAGTPDVTAVSRPEGGWASLKFADLQAAAKSRQLSGQGTGEVLVARLEAADKDDDETAAEAALNAVADAADTTAAN